MAKFRGRTAIRSSERGRAEERVPSKKSKTAPFETDKGCGTLPHFGAMILVISDIEIYVPPSMMASALSRDTKSVQAASGLFSLHLRGTLLFLSFRPRLARESNGGIWFHQQSIRPPTSDHDSFFRRRDRSREQGAQSA